MAVFANIGGSSKQLSSIYGNIGGASKKLSSLYANIKGSSKDLLKVSYTWYRFPATSYEDCLGTNSTFTHTDTDYRECSLCGGHHYYYSGYLYLSDGDKLYPSYSFNSTAGIYVGTGTAVSYSSDDRNQYVNYYYPNNYDHCVYKVGYYTDNGVNEHGWDNGSGHDVTGYRFAKPLAYSTSYKTITSDRPYYSYGYYYTPDDDNWEHFNAHSFDPNDGANNDEMEYYTGYYVKYMGAF